MAEDIQRGRGILHSSRICFLSGELDCEQSLLSPGMLGQDRKGGTADNRGRNEIRFAQTTVKLAPPSRYINYLQIKSTLEKYDGYSEEVFEELIRVLNEVGINLERDRVYLKDVVELQTKLKSKKYPTYMLVFNLITLAGLLSPEGNQNLFCMYSI